MANNDSDFSKSLKLLSDLIARSDMKQKRRYS